MREIQMHPPAKRKPYEVVRRLEFFANGAELVAWVGSDELTIDGRVGFTCDLRAYDTGTDSPRQLYTEWVFDDWIGYRTPDPVIAPGRALLVYESRADEESYVWFEEIVEQEEGPGSLPHLPGCQQGLGGLVFTPDGKELIAVRNLAPNPTAQFVPDVVQFKMAALNDPPVGFQEKINPLTRQVFQARVYDVRWQTCMTLPDSERITTIALSVDGRLIAAGGSEGVVHVADLKRKKVLATFPYPGRKFLDREAVRVAFDPAAGWVVMLANGRLFARPLGAGKAWQTKATLGYAHDFAFHPDGRVLCAVFADGQARYFDPHTGAVRQSFKWAKKPKPLYSVAFAPDGLTCAAGSENGVVVLWDVDA